jgi:hypothetical protein
MSKAAELAALIGSQSSLSNRNLVINGDMAVAQRGTSATSQSGTDIRLLDKWQLVEGGDAVFTIAQSTTAPDGFNNSLKIDTTTADSSLSTTQFASVKTRFEGLNLQQLQFGTSSAKPLTLSFWVRSNVTGTYSVMIALSDATNIYQSHTYAISSADTWEKKTITFIGDTTTAIPDDNTSGFLLDFCLGSGTAYTSGGATGSAWSSSATSYFGGHAVNIMASTSNEFLLTGVQLEIGEVATPFEHESYADNLKKCKRYFIKYINSSGAYAVGAIEGTTTAIFSFPAPDMRAAPTAAIDDLTIGGGIGSPPDVTAISSVTNTGHSLDCTLTVASGLTATNAARIRATGSDSLLTFDAEL